MYALIENTNVCLIGPVSSGKTSLLATLKEAIDDGVHGYSPADQFAITELASDEQGSDSSFGRLKYGAGEFGKLENRFKIGELPATRNDKTYRYRLNLRRLRGGLADIQLVSEVNMTVIDAAGGLMFPTEVVTESDEHGTAVDETMKKVRDDLIDLMEVSDAVVLALKVTLPESPSWKREFTNIIDTVCETQTRRLKRFVVAFNQYERLFVRFGASAFQYATDPKIACYALQQACLKADWLKPLQRLRGSGVEVMFVPTSPFGFVKNFGNPNLTMVNGEMERFDHNNPMSLLWRPFCSADPFIFAATGEPTGLMFTVDQMYGLPHGSQRPSPGAAPEKPGVAPPSPPPPRREIRNNRFGAWLKGITNSLNVNGGE